MCCIKWLNVWSLTLLSLTYAAHVIYTQQNVLLSVVTPLLAGSETINLPAIPLVPNRRYAITLNSTTPNVTRTLLGASGLNGGQCALVYFGCGKNNTQVYPVSYTTSFATFDYFLAVNGVLGPSTMTVALALQAFTFGSDFTAPFLDGIPTGFGQTFSSGSQTVLNMISLQVAAGQTSANSMYVTLQLYDLSGFGASENVQFPYAQETSGPTFAPTLAPTTGTPTTNTPTQNPTTSNPTTSNPTTSNPTTSNPTSSNPTKAPTKSPATKSSATNNPTTNNPITSIPTTNPTTHSPTHRITTGPTSLNPTPIRSPTSTFPQGPASLPSSYIRFPNCAGVVFPAFLASCANASCVESMVFTDGAAQNAASDVVVSSIRDISLPGSTVDNLNVSDAILFVVELTDYGVEAIQDNVVQSGFYSLYCVWFSYASKHWETSGVWIMGADEAVNSLLQNASSARTYVCATTHLSTFALILRRNEDCLSCRTTMQLVCTSIALLLSMMSLLQTFRVLFAAKLCTRLVLMHAALFVAGITMSAVAYLFPTLAPTHPGILILLSSFVTMIALGAYFNLMYTWIAPLVASSSVDPMYKLTWFFLISYGVLAVSLLTVPVILLTASPDGVARWATGGSYFMCAVLVLVFGGIGTSSCCVYRKLTRVATMQISDATRTSSNSIQDAPPHSSSYPQPRTRGGSKLRKLWCQHKDGCCPLPRRLLLSSVLLCLSILSQAILWILSIRASVLSSVIMTNAIEWGFNISLFVTFFTLLFLFWFGVHKVTTLSDSLSRERVKRRSEARRNTPRQQHRTLGSSGMRKSATTSSLGVCDDSRSSGGEHTLLKSPPDISPMMATRTGLATSIAKASGSEDEQSSDPSAHSDEDASTSSNRNARHIQSRASQIEMASIPFPPHPLGDVVECDETPTPKNVHVGESKLSVPTVESTSFSPRSGAHASSRLSSIRPSPTFVIVLSHPPQPYQLADPPPY